MSKLSDALRKKSEELNLFSTGDREKLDEKHIPDSLAVMEFWEVEDGMRVLDLGTGGGLPGLALAEANPELQFLLLDAREKKVNAVNDVITELGLENARAVTGRFEHLAHESDFRESFDICLARAVAPLPTLLEYVSGFLSVGSVFYAWKGSVITRELESSAAALGILGMELDSAYEYKLPSGEPRNILKFFKITECPEKYPRNDGVPKNRPL